MTKDELKKAKKIFKKIVLEYLEEHGKITEQKLKDGYYSSKEGLNYDYVSNTR